MILTSILILAIAKIIPGSNQILCAEYSKSLSGSYPPILSCYVFVLFDYMQLCCQSYFTLIVMIVCAVFNFDYRVSCGANWYGIVLAFHRSVFDSQPGRVVTAA